MTRRSLLLLYVFALLSLVFHSRDGEACIETERQALLKIKQGLIDEFGYLSSWGNEEDRDCCNWEGLFCNNKSSHVTDINLSSFSLRGKFNPYHLANLSSMQTLYLSYSFVDINGRLEWLNHLPYIKDLRLNQLNLSEANDWLQVVLKLPHLTHLELDNCSLPDPVAPSLSFINSSTSLATLQLSNNHLTSTNLIFQGLFNSTNSLAHLDLSGNQLQGSISYAFGNMIFLEYLDLSLNQLDGGFPNPKIFLSLYHLDLSYNQLNGTVPESIGNLSKLDYLNVAENSFEGEISEAHFSKLFKLYYLELSSNSFVLDFSFDWEPPFNLYIIGLQSCKLGPHFPKWLQTQNEYFVLDISNAEISDSIPNWFWCLNSQTAVMNLSYNQLHGKIANFSVEFPNFIFVDLSSNQIEGPIPPFLFQVSLLNLSKNKFSGIFSFLCALIDVPLSFLDLSNNLLLGKLPDCWMNLKSLKVLNLANNNFYGEIPNSIGFLHNIQFLQLRNNSFIGELPSSLRNCTRLRTIHLGGNRLSGPIPSWIGDSLSNLVVLSLRSNQFNGTVPMHLCHLRYVHLLDLSSNHLSGSIPKCLNNLTALTLKGSSSLIMTPFLSYWSTTFNYLYLDSAVLVWKGREFEYKKTLGLLKSIDFSSNNLAGEIPEEITALVGLVSLNLSRNNLIGEITPKIGQLSSLDFLDLSRNQLVGKIPSGLSQLSGLSVLDLSNNNLSGKIPIGTQLQSFNASVYAENSKLCGLPLPDKCPEEASPKPAIVHEDEDRFITFGFYVSMVLGFIIGFWGVFGSLVLNSSWRYAYFKFLNDIKDKIYMVAAVHFNRLQRRLCN